MMSQEKINNHEAVKGWESWMNNLIIEETIRKENIPFYPYSEFKNVELINGNICKATFKPFQRAVALKHVPLSDYFTLDSLISEVSLHQFLYSIIRISTNNFLFLIKKKKIKRHRKLEIHDCILKFYGLTKQGKKKKINFYSNIYS